MPVCWFCNGLAASCEYCGGTDDASPKTPVSRASAKKVVPDQLEWEAPDGSGELKRITDVYLGNSPLLVEVGGIFAPVAGSGATSFDAIDPPIPQLPTEVSEALQNSPEALTCIRWMMQKVALRQDMLLLGDFGPTARHLAIVLCQLLQKKFEYLALSRDTTEADLTERVELVATAEEEAGSSACVSSEMRPAAPVRAACAGHFLILEGVDRAERNVLSALNNLLENRELPLRAGLLSRKGEGELKVLPDFLVIAIATPAKRYPQSGVAALDPPLRSRLAAYSVPQITAPEDEPRVRRIVKSIQDLKAELAGDYPASFNLASAAKENGAFPNLDLASVLRSVWPYQYFLIPKLITEVDKALSSMPGARSDPYRLAQISVDKDGRANLTFTGSVKKYSACCGSYKAVMQGALDQSKEHPMLGALLRDHCLDRHVLLIGDRGCGKTSLVRRFAEVLGYRCRTVYCTAETDARDLTLRRVISPGGSTTYEATPVVEAALAGDILVLDGIERLPVGLLHSVLAQLMQDRTLELVDGRRFLPPSVTDDEEIPRVHPSFRVFATASLSSQLTLDASVRSLFGAVRVLPWTPVADPLKALKTLSHTSAEPVLQYSASSRELASQNPGDFAPYALTWRQTLAAVQREQAGSKQRSTGIYDAVYRCFAARLRFAMPHVRKEVEKMLEDTLGKPAKAPLKSLDASDVTIDEQMVQIDNVSVSRGGDVADEAKEELDDPTAPSPASFGRHGAAFVDVPQHLQVLKGMLTEWSLGRHLLLIGPQGVGKNRLADRLCEMLGRRREYIQLHRDTTVARLTRAAVLESGRVTYRDSALLNAAALGRVLVVDEVDKAPLEVACVLRALADDALDLGLADGRRLVARGVPSGGDLQKKHSTGGEDIVVHEGFRMILLANPPGHPFRGTDFFGECGDVFSGFAVEPLESGSERALLSLVAPRVPLNVIDTLARLSAELRQAYSTGSLKYPYSIREVLQIARHLDAFPDDPLQEVAMDVFAFDSADSEVMPVLEPIWKKIQESEKETKRAPAVDTSPPVRGKAAKRAEITLTFEQAFDMQYRLIKEYSKTEFQRALHKAMAGTEADPTAQVIARSETCLPVQMKVIPLFGFTPDKRGVQDSLRSFRNPALFQHPRTKELNAQSGWLNLLVNPALQDENFRAQYGVGNGPEGADQGLRFWAVPAN